MPPQQSIKLIIADLGYMSLRSEEEHGKSGCRESLSKHGIEASKEASCADN